jgi:hypothetical protein
VVGEGVAARAQVLEEEEGSCKVYSGPVLSRRRRVALVRRSFTETPRGSNSTETALSVVNLRIERRFWMMEGAMRTSWRWNGPGREE